MALRGCLAGGLLAGSASAKELWKGYLYLDKLKGESTDAAHKDYSDVLSLSEGVTAPWLGWTKGGRPSVGRPEFAALSVTTILDRTSLDRYRRLAAGTMIDSATVDLVGTGKQGPGGLGQLLKIEMKDVLLSGVTTAGRDSGDIAETVLLNAREITIGSVKVWVADGKLAAERDPSVPNDDESDSLARYPVSASSVTGTATA